MTAQQMTKKLTVRQWHAIINALRNAAATYVPGHDSVNFNELADSLAADVLIKQTVDSTETDLNTNFRPTDEQVTFASEYAKHFDFDSVFVAVNFPGKQRGLWLNGQAREEVFRSDGSFAHWIDRGHALDALDSGKYGNAIFRVYSDGFVALVNEK